MFDLSNLSNPPLECEFKPHPGIADGEGVKLFVNQDYITAERIDALNQSIHARTKELLKPPAQPKQLEAKLPETADEDIPAPVETAEETAEPQIEEAVPETMDSFFILEKEQIRLRAEMLGGRIASTDPSERLIHSWNVVSGDRDVPVCFETFFKMSAKMQKELFNFCMNPEADEKKSAKGKR